MASLPEYKPLPQYERVYLLSIIPKLGRDGVELLESMLDWDPERRISASEATRHVFFKDL
jgi:serine/threonine protein kinase